MNLVLSQTVIRQDKEGRYSLNDLHRAAIASGLPVERKNPAEFLRTDMAQNFVESLEKFDETTTEKSVVPFTVKNGGKNHGTYAVRLLALRYCGWLSSDFEVMVYKTFDKFASDDNKRKFIRENARSGHRDMTDALKSSIESSGRTPQGIDYAIENDMINQVALRMKTRQYRQEKNLKDSDQTRDHESKFEIYAVNELQKLDTSLIKIGFSLDQRRETLEKHYEELRIKSVGMDFDEIERIKREREAKMEARLMAVL